MLHYLASVLALYFVSGVVSHEQVDPLTAPDYVQDTTEELERKWAQDVISGLGDHIHFTDHVYSGASRA